MIAEDVSPGGKTVLAFARQRPAGTSMTECGEMKLEDAAAAFWAPGGRF